MEDVIDPRSVPIILFVLVPISFIVIYAWGLSGDHFNAFFPFVSDLGALNPEGELFSQVCNLAALLFAVTFYFRYLVLRDFADGSSVKRYHGLVLSNLVLGLLGSFGITLVANYAELFIVPLHTLGAFMVFGLGVIYMWIDVHLSLHAHVVPSRTKLRMTVRIVLACLATLSFVFMFTASRISYTNQVVEPKNIYERLHWSREMGGYKAHIVAAVCEWTLLITELLYFATFIPEFKYFRMDFPKLNAVDPSATPVKNRKRLQEEFDATEESESKRPLMIHKQETWSPNYGTAGRPD